MATEIYEDRQVNYAFKISSNQTKIYLYLKKRKKLEGLSVIKLQVLLRKNCRFNLFRALNWFHPVPP
jgi:hypothetical protein